MSKRKSGNPGTIRVEYFVRVEKRDWKQKGDGKVNINLLSPVLMKLTIAVSMLALLAACQVGSNVSDAEAAKQMQEYIRGYQGEGMFGPIRLSNWATLTDLKVTDRLTLDQTTTDVIFQGTYNIIQTYKAPGPASDALGHLLGVPTRTGPWVVTGIRGRFRKYDRGGWKLEPTR